MVGDKIWAALNSKVADCALKLSVAVLIIITSVSTYGHAEVARCQADYNQAAAQRIVELTEATNEERESSRRADDAMSNLVNQLLTSSDKAKTAKLFVELQTALKDQTASRATADEARKEHPPIPIPEEYCR